MAAITATPSATRKASLRSLRWPSRQGSRFMRGISVETPQCEPARRQERGGIALHRLRLGTGRQLHLAERIALLGGDPYAAGNHFGDARDVGAAAAHQDLLGLLAPRAGCEIELQRATDLLGHVVDERIEHFGLVVAREPAFLLGASGLLHR